MAINPVWVATDHANKAWVLDLNPGAVKVWTFDLSVSTTGPTGFIDIVGLTGVNTFVPRIEYGNNILFVADSGTPNVYSINVASTPTLGATYSVSGTITDFTTASLTAGALDGLIILSDVLTTFNFNTGGTPYTGAYTISYSGTFISKLNFCVSGSGDGNRYLTAFVSDPGNLSFSSSILYSYQAFLDSSSMPPFSILNLSLVSQADTTVTGDVGLSVTGLNPGFATIHDPTASQYYIAKYNNEPPPSQNTISSFWDTWPDSAGFSSNILKCDFSNGYAIDTTGQLYHYNGSFTVVATLAHIPSSLVASIYPDNSGTVNSFWGAAASTTQGHLYYYDIGSATLTDIPFPTLEPSFLNSASHMKVDHVAQTYDITSGGGTVPTAGYYIPNNTNANVYAKLCFDRLDNAGVHTIPDCVDLKFLVLNDAGTVSIFYFGLDAVWDNIDGGGFGFGVYPEIISGSHLFRFNFVIPTEYNATYRVAIDMIVVLTSY